MTKDQILEELPKLHPKDRSEVLVRLHELTEHDLLAGLLEAEPSSAEKELLDKEWADYSRNRDPGTSWDEVRSRLNSSR